MKFWRWDFLQLQKLANWFQTKTFYATQTSRTAKANATTLPGEMNRGELNHIEISHIRLYTLNHSTRHTIWHFFWVQLILVLIIIILYKRRIMLIKHTLHNWLKVSLSHFFQNTSTSFFKWRCWMYCNDTLFIVTCKMLWLLIRQSYKRYYMKNINAKETKINLVVENISYNTDANASDF